MGMRSRCLPKQPAVALSQASEVAYQVLGCDFFYFINLGELSMAPYSPIHALSELACIFQGALQTSLGCLCAHLLPVLPGGISVLPFLSVVGEEVANGFLSSI